MRNIVFAFVVMLFISNKTFACDCSTIIDYEKSDLVFTGEVIEIRGKGKYGKSEIVFKVHKYQKGRKQKKEIVINVPCLTNACCGIDFQVGKKYKVFALKQNDCFTTNICTETAEIEKK